MTSDINNQRDHEAYKENFDNLPFERTLEVFRVRKIKEILENFDKKNFDQILEVGPGYNSLSNQIYPTSHFTLIEPSTSLYLKSKKVLEKYTNINFLNLSLEDLDTSKYSEYFDLIVLSSVLHEIQNPLEALRKVNSLLKNDGIALVVVPNNESAHRLFGVALGLLKSTKALTSTEIQMQQFSNYSFQTLSDLIIRSGMQVAKIESSFIKPHTHKKMQEWIDDGKLSPEILNQFYELSEFFEPFNSELFALAKKVNSND